MPLSCVIVSKNTPKFLIKPEAPCSKSLHKPLVSQDQGGGGGLKNDVVIYEQPLMTKRIPITSDNILTRTMKLTCLMMILSKEGNLDFVSVVRTMRLRGAVI